MKKLLFLLILLITGCTEYNDLSELTIIKSIGISYNEEYLIYAQVIDYIDNNNEAHMKVINGKGETLEEGFNNLENEINKEAFFSHVDLLILDNNLNDENYRSIINFFINNNNFRNDFYCVFSSQIYKLLEKSKYDEIDIFLKKNVSNTKDLNNVLKEYIDNKKIILPNILYNNKISYLGNYRYNKGDKNA